MPDQRGAETPPAPPGSHGPLEPAEMRSQGKMNRRSGLNQYFRDHPALKHLCSPPGRVVAGMPLLGRGRFCLAHPGKKHGTIWDHLGLRRMIATGVEAEWGGVFVQAGIRRKNQQSKKSKMAGSVSSSA